jgi:alcohol dehydrogenase (cytochrome c)
MQAGWGVDAQRIQDALVTQNIGVEANVPQGECRAQRRSGDVS